MRPHIRAMHQRLRRCAARQLCQRAAFPRRRAHNRCPPAPAHPSPWHLPGRTLPGGRPIRRPILDPKGLVMPIHQHRGPTAPGQRRIPAVQHKCLWHRLSLRQPGPAPVPIGEKTDAGTGKQDRISCLEKVCPPLIGLAVQEFWLLHGHKCGQRSSVVGSRPSANHSWHVGEIDRIAIVRRRQSQNNSACLKLIPLCRQLSSFVTEPCEPHTCCNFFGGRQHRFVLRQGYWRAKAIVSFVHACACRRSYMHPIVRNRFRSRLLPPDKFILAVAARWLRPGPV